MSEPVDWEARSKREVQLRHRTERKLAKTNLENVALIKKARDLDWENRMLKLRLENSHNEAFRRVHDRLRLIREIATTPYDDWIANASEPETLQMRIS